MQQFTTETKKVLLFDETHVGYWTGDCECSCFNPISPLHDERTQRDFSAWSDACTYIRLAGLDKTKKYKITLHVEAEEIEDMAR